MLDPRLTTKRYGNAFLESLPRYRLVRERKDCAEFFERLRSGLESGGS